MEGLPGAGLDGAGPKGFEAGGPEPKEKGEGALVRGGAAAGAVEPKPPNDGTTGSLVAGLGAPNENGAAVVVGVDAALPKLKAAGLGSSGLTGVPKGLEAALAPNEKGDAGAVAGDGAADPDPNNEEVPFEV